VVTLKSQTDPFTMVERMGRGMNLGNTFSAPVEGNWAPVVYEQYFIDVKQAGFTNVRIPMDFYGNRTSGNTTQYSNQANTSGDYNGTINDYVVDQNYLNRIEEIINWSLNQDLVTIIDFHGAELKSQFLYTFLNSNSQYTYPTSAKRAADLDKFKAIWLAIANRFKNYSDNLLFEIVNEPYFEVNATEMDALNSMIIAAIRSTGDNNTMRNIIITGGGVNSFNAPQQISDAVISSDDYLIASFHYYQPFPFTSSSTANNDDFNWGTNADKNSVDGHFDTMEDWSNSKNIPVTLGEFGADNENGLNYNTGVYGEYGGPDNADRIEYHRYIAEQSINRGFSFSAWDAGNKSNKTIHLRTDNPSTNNVIGGTWVTEVRDALLSSGSWPLCYGPTDNRIILNPGFECGFDTDWSFNVSGTAVASFSDATSDSRNGVSGAKVEVTSSDNYNKVLLSNQIFTQDLTGKKVIIKAYAKSATAVGQSFKIRIKVNNTYSYILSQEFDLTNEYPTSPFLFEFTIPDNTTSIQAQVMMGNFQGTYFLDDFEAIIEDVETLSSEQITATEKVVLYPNPSYGIVYMDSNLSNLNVSVYSIHGKVILKNKKVINKSLDISSLERGIYIIVVENENYFGKFKIIMRD
tara:strand:+ start:23261 stop:25159 length:1899 start_codon:yes stop_codon:yes gene_type:complete